MEIVPTWGRIGRISWGLLWRTILIFIPAAFLCVVGLTLTHLLFRLPAEEHDLGLLLLLLIASWATAHFAAVKLTVGKLFGDYRLELTPYDEPSETQEISPPESAIIIEGKVLNWTYPQILEFSINGIPSHRTKDYGENSFIVTTVEGEEVAHLGTEALLGKTTTRLTSNREDDPVITVQAGILSNTFYLKDQSVKVSKTKRKQVIAAINMEVRQSPKRLKAIGEKSDAEILSPAMLIGLLSYIHLPQRSSLD